MSITEYYRRHPRLISEKSAYLEKEFLENVFYPEFGDAGLEYLTYQKKIYDSNHRRSYYIDFVVNVDGRRFAIELDGYNYHGKLSAKEFEKQEERTNEIIRQGYELIRFSFNKIKNKPSEVRRELRQRINIPRDEVTISMAPASNSTQSISDKEKKNPIPTIIISVLVILLLFFIVPYVLVKLAQESQVKNVEKVKNSQLSYIQSFVDDHNKKSTYKISNLKQIDPSDETGEFYRRTNTYGSNSTFAMHGNIDKSDVWIISCSVDVPTHMRVYAESTDYVLLTDLVHTSIPYLNPHSTDNNERLERFDSMIQDSQYGLYIENINGTYTVLKQNNDTGALVNKEKAKDWRLNMNTGCMDIWY